jgi:hypothetical protein
VTAPCIVDFGPSERLTTVQSGFTTHSEEAMKYLCLIYDEEKKMAAMSKSEGDAFMGEYGVFTEAVKTSGHYVGGNPLQPVHTATTIRVRNGKLSTTDGPFAETKEQLGGYYLIEANDLNDAIQVASRVPSAKTGSIEVRPIMVFNH